MKFLFTTTLILLTFSSWAKPTLDKFNSALQENIEKDVQQDRHRKASAGRGPASVEEEKPQPVFHHNHKIDKTVRQIGSDKW